VESWRDAWSGSGRYWGLAAADHKGGGPEKAGNDVDGVENETEGHGFLGGNAQRDEEKDKCAFTDSKTGNADGEHLKNQNCRVERKKGGESEPAEAKSRRNHQGSEAKRDLVDEAGGENGQCRERLTAKFCDAPMDGIDEAAPSIGCCESTAKSGVIRSKKNDHERNKRDECNGESKQRGAAKFTESWVDGEPEKCDEREY
jgi:hypothetical protein